MSFFTKKEQIVILLLAIVIICAIGYSVLTNENITIVSKDEKGNMEIGVKTTDEENQDDLENQEVNDVEEGIEEQTIKVHICGQVHNPGVVELPQGAILLDGIEHVVIGGHIEGEANLERVNLARKLTDEEWIYIPKIGEELDDSEIYVLPDTVNNNEGMSSNGRININKASKETLIRLPQIGEVRADSIIEFRKKNEFSSINEITNVPGIGPAIFDSIKDLITVD